MFFFFNITIKDFLYTFFFTYTIIIYTSVELENTRHLLFFLCACHNPGAAGSLCAWYLVMLRESSGKVHAFPKISGTTAQ